MFLLVFTGVLVMLIHTLVVKKVVMAPDNILSRELPIRQKAVKLIYLKD
jgi:hypothetical protein